LRIDYLKIHRGETKKGKNEDAYKSLQKLCDSLKKTNNGLLEFKKELRMSTG
jgi:hypothetical protein